MEGESVSVLWWEGSAFVQVLIFDEERNKGEEKEKGRKEEAPGPPHPTTTHPLPQNQSIMTA